MLKETIVVEGKNDAAAVRRAVEADIIITSGFGINKGILDRIKTAQEKNGVIVLTDPDFMGEKIRKIISDRIKGVKHAFIPKEEAQAEGDIGVENAAPGSILRALSMAKCELEEVTITFTGIDLVYYGLSGSDNAASLRNSLGAALGIGYANSKQFVNRLNKYGISRDELESAMEIITDGTN
ncbi:MAG TPA: ribonuclease M5, partial [Patescibacteria group bacterium]|nr:ribonuclease M5 [Patescibacteria group bacterium]